MGFVLNYTHDILGKLHRGSQTLCWYLIVVEGYNDDRVS